MHDGCLSPANLRELGKSSQKSSCGDAVWILQGLLHWALAVSFDITCLVRGLSFPHPSLYFFWFVNLWELQLVALASSPH